MTHRGLASILATVLLFGLSACGGKEGGGSGSGVQLSGVLAGGQAARAAGIAREGLETGQSVDQVLAIPMDRGSLNSWAMQNSKSSAVAADGSFALSLGTDYDWLLVLIDSTASDETRYVGSLAVTTGATDGLLNLPISDAVIKQLDLGTVTLPAEGDASSSQGVEAADFNMSADQLTALAKNDNLFKNAKNMVNNYGTFNNGDGIWYQFRPDFGWSGAIASIEGMFSNPDAYVYGGMGFQLDGNPHSVTMEQIQAGSVELTLEPPQPVTIGSTEYSVFTFATPDCKTLQVEGHADSLECWSGPLYASGAYEDISYSVVSGIQGNPPGYWTWKQDNVVKAMFDVSGVNPPITAGGKAKGFVPSYKVNLGPDNLILSVDIRWFYYDEALSAYVELQPADLAILEHFVRATEIKLENTYNNVRQTEEIYVDPATTNVVPTKTWYLGPHDADPSQATGLMGFYESGGFGYFFSFFVPMIG